MTNEEIKEKLTQLVATERKITNEILDLLVTAMERRSFLEFGFSNIFIWLTEGLGYSAGAAHRRIEAARMVRSAPEVKEKLIKGDLNLTTLSKIQTAIRAQSRIAPVSADDRSRALAAVEHKSLPETEKVLVELFPAAKSAIRQDRRTTIDENTTRFALNLPNEVVEKLARAREVLSHKFPNATDAEVIAYALEFFLEKKDVLRQRVARPESQMGARKELVKSAEARCSYRDLRTGHRCTSKYQIQVDHIKPRSLGGKDEKSNFRALCRQHNLYEAERILGPGLMERYRRRP
jgi:hypothetical protein